jgi:DNA-binding transcriptional regulator GbsR (MarR family)
MTLQQLRETTQQDSGTLSPYLKRMIAANILEKTAETPRNAVYSIKDSLFKLWLSSF